MISVADRRFDARLALAKPGELASERSSARIHKLASFGLVPGSEIRPVSRRPAVVLECGATSIAVEDEIGREIYVRVNAA